MQEEQPHSKHCYYGLDFLITSLPIYLLLIYLFKLRQMSWSGKSPFHCLTLHIPNLKVNHQIYFKNNPLRGAPGWLSQSSVQLLSLAQVVISW